MSQPRGHVRQHGKGWVVVVTTDKRHPTTGKQIRKWHSGYRNKSDAERARTEILASIDDQQYVEPGGGTLAAYLVKRWLPAIEPTVRPNTHRLYSTIVNAYIVPNLGAIRLQDLTPADILAMYGALSANGGRSDKGLSAKSVRNVHTTLRKALGDAVEWGLLVRNPATSAKPPQHRRPKPRTWTAAELGRFLEHVRGDRLDAAFLLAATTGLRRSELLGLPWEAVDLDGGVLSVYQTLVLVGSTPQITADTKTNESRRQVALDGRTVAALREHRRCQLEERIAWAGAYQDHGLVFAREDGTPVRPDWLTRRFARLTADLELPVIGLHGLRHSHASLALIAGVHPKTVADRLGHSSITTTLDLYSHLIPALQPEAAEKVAALVFGRSPHT